MPHPHLPLCLKFTFYICVKNLNIDVPTVLVLDTQLLSPALRNTQHLVSMMPLLNSDISTSQPALKQMYTEKAYMVRKTIHRHKKGEAVAPTTCKAERHCPHTIRPIIYPSCYLSTYLSIPRSECSVEKL